LYDDLFKSLTPSFFPGLNKFQKEHVKEDV
jgi:hypothetical protein